MHIGEICTRSVVTCRRDPSATGLARLMRERQALHPARNAPPGAGKLNCKGCPLLNVSPNPSGLLKFDAVQQRSRARDRH